MARLTEMQMEERILRILHYARQVQVISNDDCVELELRYVCPTCSVREQCTGPTLFPRVLDGELTLAEAMAIDLKMRTPKTQDGSSEESS